MFVQINIVVAPEKGMPQKIPVETKKINFNFMRAMWYEPVSFDHPAFILGARTMVTLAPGTTWCIREKVEDIDAALMTVKIKTDKIAT